MKMLFITNNFPPKVDGVGDYTYFLGRELCSRGHEVHVLCKQNEKVRSLFDGIRVHPLIEAWTSHYYDIALAQIKTIQPDWVLFQYVPYGFHPLGMPVAIVRFMRRIRKSGFRIFVFFHEFFIGLRFSSPKAAVVALAQMWITKRMCQYADQVATSTDHYVQVLKQWRKDIYQIPVGSNIPFEEVAQPSHKPDSPFTIITFGLRNVQDILSFFKLIQQEVEDIELVVCGKQNLPAEQGSIKNVHFTGYLPAEEVARRLTQADVFLLPDLVTKKGDGGTCLKSGSLAAAFAAGLPIIGMKGKMNDRVLKEIEGVQLVDYYQHESWKSAILELYHHRNGTPSRRAAIRDFYEKHLSWKSIGDQYLEIIEQ